MSLDRDDHSGDDEFFRAITSAILLRLENSHKVPNPANTEENLNRLSTDDSNAFASRFHELLSIADRASAARTKTASANIWSEAFDHFFPVPDESDAEEAVLKLAEDSRAVATTAFNSV